MDAIEVGDQVWCQFVDVALSEQRAWVYPMTVVMIAEDGQLICRDERIERSRALTEDVENVCRSEAEAWRACELAFQRVAGECLTKASECAAKAKGVANVMA
jgi:hypothetical protein